MTQRSVKLTYDGFVQEWQDNTGEISLCADGVDKYFYLPRRAENVVMRVSTRRPTTDDDYVELLINSNSFLRIVNTSRYDNVEFVYIPFGVFLRRVAGDDGDTVFLWFEYDA